MTKTPTNQTKLFTLFLFCFLSFFIKGISQTCSLGNPVFIEDFGSGTARLGPSLNQDPNTDVHPDFRPAQLYTYVGGNGTVGYDQYGLMKNPVDAAPGGAWWNNSFTDHTGNTNGYLYYCDAGTDLNVFYAQKIDGLCNDIEYELSAWFAKSNEPGYFIDPNIKLIVGFTDANDIPLGNIVDTDTGSITGIGANRWHQKTLVFTVPSGTENIYFMLKNNVSGQQGNDLVIDDIEVRPCGPQIEISDATNNVINNDAYCLSGTTDTTINLSANIPSNFVMIWQESTSPDVWTDLTYETATDLNYTIPANSNSFHHFRLKFAHNADNLLNSSCNFFTDPVYYYFTDAQTAPNLKLCDDDNNGTATFDLTQQNNLINDSPEFTITYHESLTDAQTGTPLITTPENYGSGYRTVYARVENNYNPDCFAISNFNLEVYNSAFPLDALSITPIQECDDSSVGTDIDGFKIIDITQRDTEILNGQSALEFTLTYFTDALYVNKILNPTTFINTISSGQTIYVRMTNNNFIDCFSDTSFQIEINALPEVNMPDKYSQCDDASNDGIAPFNLTLNHIKEEINPDYLAEGLIFLYYNDQNEAENRGINITTPENFQNKVPFTNEIVYIRVENPSGCHRIVSIELQVNPSGSALDTYNPLPLHQCDDGLDDRDGISTFDMSSIKTHIENTLFSSISVTAHFYESQINAELEINEVLNIDTHQNTNSPNSQNIWVRIKSNLGNDCLGLKEFQNLLIVESLPIANPASLNAECDYDSTDTILSFPFDTSQIETTVLGNQNPAEVTITYFDEQGNTLPSPLPNPFLTENQTITIRVTNNITQDPDGACFDETTLEFIIDEQPIANSVSSQIFCDDGLDSTDINDGLHSFNTSSFSDTVLGNQTNMDIYFSYINENGVTITDATELPNPLVSGTQTITANVINPENSNCIASTTIDLIVNPIPDFTINEEEIVCTSDPTFIVTLTPVQSNPSEVFDYSWTFEGSEISNNTTLDVSNPGNYSVALTNPTTLCSTTKTVSVKASELATITQDNITVIDISENNSVTINNPESLGSGTYQFALESKDSSVIFPYQDSPVFNNVRAGDYKLYVKDDICGTAEIDVFVIGYRKFFTPNGDGQNDLWKIQGLNSSQASSLVYIYNRYGKLIKQLNPLGNGWDGTFNGELLATDDYWFTVELTDGRSFTGHFTLKR
ncbi:T9SS type B sorting domain-containing protein [Aestuariibaculum lutulentum]|uniref:T9SS type B sorting domain-containing protein n=1 Tax=Aestuariibaculum lutulentum TaxID=2920935 RepID=A0ABS9RDM3_9FLAO|nr:T9SS type B sorting domain-containing protein [Aestuariibaculum lutulentum]MCH4551040.1 T9SS type B sorting domain-containing protein [Aestuariibaculum lutulentum]